MKDLRLLIRVKNNRLLSHREKLKLTQGEMARLCGITVQAYAELENLKHYPLHKTSCRWSNPALKVAEFLEIPVQELFPEAFEKIKAEGQYEIGLSELPIIERLVLEGPEEEITKKDQYQAIQDALKTLTPREKRVLEMRFGLNGEEPHTLEQAGEKEHVNRERMRQIQLKAFRKLRHPTHAKVLKPYL